MELNHPEATLEALRLLRSGAPFQWYVIPMLAFAIYIYIDAIQKKNWKGISAGLALYMVHWFVEIINALIQHFSGHALWTVPTGTSFLILIGVGVELSIMFSVSGLVLSGLLPEDPKMKILGVNNRILFVLGNAAFYSIFEIFLVKTPAFVWVYPWWGPSPCSSPFIFLFLPRLFIATTGNPDGRSCSSVLYSASTPL